MGEGENSMIQGDNKNCKIIWFHQKSARMKQIPKGNWYCSECKNLIKVRKNRYLISPF